MTTMIKGGGRDKEERLRLILWYLSGLCTGQLPKALNKDSKALMTRRAEHS